MARRPAGGRAEGSALQVAVLVASALAIAVLITLALLSWFERLS